MLENSFVRKVLYTNPLILTCITFTIVTVIDLVLTVFTLGDDGTTYHHLGSRLILCTFVSVSLLVFRFKKIPIVLLFSIHFIAFLLFAVFYVWLNSFFVEQHPDAMKDIIRTVFITYPPIAGGIILIDYLQKRMKRVN